MYVFLIYVTDPISGDSRSVRLQADEATFDAPLWGASFPDVDGMVQQLKASIAGNPPKTLVRPA